MQDQENKPNLTGKLFYSHYTLGDRVLEGWEAKPVSDTDFEVTRHDGSKTSLTLGGTVPSKDGPVEVELDKNDNLKVGDYTVVVGEDIQQGWDAKKMGKADSSEYLIRIPDEKSQRVKLGEPHSTLGVVELDEYNNLSTDRGAVKVLEKEYELSLLVFDKKERGGFQAYLNVLTPGDEDGGHDGVKGIVYPPDKKGKPLKFSEEGEGGKMFATATFWPTRNDMYAKGQTRTLEDAAEESRVLREVKDLEKKARQAGIEPDYLPGYDDSKKLLKEYNNDSWKGMLFTVQKGKELLREASNTSHHSHSGQSSQREYTTP